MSRRSPEPYFHSMNGQNLVSDHLIKGAPASLYNLTKSAPDPLANIRVCVWILIMNMNLHKDPFPNAFELPKMFLVTLYLGCS